ncbi:HNH endonuclease [Allorhizobium pseudoryzae]|uniref:HNH endonuclease n=1 Tax=Allorhizobium pseudoryzae TaxID=379684 RepID=UPI003D07710B
MANWPYNTTAWRKLRAAKLKASPLCQHCKERGLLKPANAVDHNIPIAKGGEPFPALEDLTSLCEPCHNEKTASHDRGQAKPFARRFKGFDTNGNPLDKSDDWHGGGASNHQKRGRVGPFGNSEDT